MLIIDLTNPLCRLTLSDRGVAPHGESRTYLRRTALLMLPATCVGRDSQFRKLFVLPYHCPVHYRVPSDRPPLPNGKRSALIIGP